MIGWASNSTVCHLPRADIRSMPTTTVIARSPCWLLLVSTGTQRGTTPELSPRGHDPVPFDQHPGTHRGGFGEAQLLKLRSPSAPANQHACGQCTLSALRRSLLASGNPDWKLRKILSHWISIALLPPAYIHRPGGTKAGGRCDGHSTKVPALPEDRQECSVDARRCHLPPPPSPLRPLTEMVSSWDSAGAVEQGGDQRSPRTLLISFNSLATRIVRRLDCLKSTGDDFRSTTATGQT